MTKMQSNSGALRAQRSFEADGPLALEVMGVFSAGQPALAAFDMASKRLVAAVRASKPAVSADYVRLITVLAAELNSIQVDGLAGVLVLSSEPATYDPSIAEACRRLGFAKVRRGAVHIPVERLSPNGAIQEGSAM